MKSRQIRRISFVLGAMAILGALLASPAMASGPPQVGYTNPVAKEITANSATVSAGINPNGASTTYQFEYGKTIAYETKTSLKSIGTKFSLVSEQLKSLKPSTTYHVRVVASNEFGTTYGEDKTFITTAGVGFFNAKTGEPLGVGATVNAVSKDSGFGSSKQRLCPSVEFTGSVTENESSSSTISVPGYVEFSGQCSDGGPEYDVTVVKETFAVNNHKLVFSTNGTFTFDSTLKYVMEWANGTKTNCSGTSTGSATWSSKSTSIGFNHKVEGGICSWMEFRGNFSLTTTGGDPVEVRLM